MDIASSFRYQHQARFAFRVTFIVMAGLVPAIGRGTLPSAMAGTRPAAMTIKSGFHPERGGRKAGVNSQ
jgi:hypothetical protein